MIKWAGSNLSEAEVDQFNAVINTNNAAALRYAVESLNNRWIVLKRATKLPWLLVKSPL